MKHLSEFLKEKRLTSGFSQMDVANALGYSTPQFISNWERGISNPPLPTLRKLANMYKVSADEMYQVVLETTIEQVKKDLHQKFYAKGKKRAG